MLSIIRHLNFFKRTCSLNGNSWEEKHDPKICLDYLVGISCMLFLSVSLVLYIYGHVFGSVLFFAITILSSLADAVFVHHYYIDLADRIFATVGVLYIVWLSTRWLINHQDWSQYIVWIKVIAQILSSVLPLKYFEQCRAFAVRTEKWRINHIMWHVTGAWGILTLLFVSHGHMDETFNSILKLGVSIL